MKNTKGFTLLELSVAVAALGVLATIAVPVYQGHITKTQVTEAFSVMEASKVKVADSMLRTGKCEIDGSTTAQGKNGVLTVSGTVVPEAMAFPKHTLKTGCVLTYKFNNADVTKHIAGKTVVADLLNSSVLSRSASTNVNDRFLPKVFKTSALDTAPTLAAVPAAPNKPTLPSLPPPPPPQAEVVVDISPTHGGSTKVDNGYHIKDTINIYDVIVAVTKTPPKSGDKITIKIPSNVAVVGSTTQKPALDFDSRFPAGVTVNVENNGLILGRGGDGVASYHPGERCPRDEYGNRLECRSYLYIMGPLNLHNGGDAIKSTGSATVHITNTGTIAGGGGGGYAAFDYDHGQDSAEDYYYGFGGAPYGLNPGASSRSSRRFAGLLRADSWIDGGGYGGDIGKDGERARGYGIAVTLGYENNNLGYYKAGCPFKGNNIKIKNVGMSAKTFGNSECPAVIQF